MPTRAVFPRRARSSGSVLTSRRCVGSPGLKVVNHHTLSDFRVEHGEALQNLFVQVLGILTLEKLITLERVTVDGTKVRAAVNKKTFSRAHKIREHLKLARAARRGVAAGGGRAGEARTASFGAAARRAGTGGTAGGSAGGGGAAAGGQEVGARQAVSGFHHRPGRAVHADLRSRSGALL